MDDNRSKQPSPTALALSTVAVCGAGLLCGYFLVAALITGEATMLTKSGTEHFYWNSEPRYYLAALGFYSFVIAAAVWVGINWLKRRKRS
jgi:hypothetical protein